MRARLAARIALALFYGVAGTLHLILPAPFLSIMPGWVPAPAGVVAMTGVAEIAGALGLVQARSKPLRRAAGWALALYALCVWPANYQHMVLDLAQDGGLGLAYHVPRLLAQPLLIWIALWSSEASRWVRPSASSG